MILTSVQKEALMRATPSNDYCIKAAKVTMRALIERGLAKHTQGFGWRYGEIIELTEEGKHIADELNYQETQKR
jgi:hypothetical protein